MVDMYKLQNPAKDWISLKEWPIILSRIKGRKTQSFYDSCKNVVFKQTTKLSDGTSRILQTLG